MFIIGKYRKREIEINNIWFLFLNVFVLRFSGVDRYLYK